MPLPITMDAINAIIVRCQSTHKTSPSNAMRKAVAIKLKATRWSRQQTQQGHCEGVVSITRKLIPQRQLSLHGHQSLQSVQNECKLQYFANQHRSQGPYAQHNDGNYHHRQHGQREQHKLCNDGGPGNNKHNNKKSLPKREGKGFKP